MAAPRFWCQRAQSRVFFMLDFLSNQRGTFMPAKDSKLIHELPAERARAVRCADWRAVQAGAELAGRLELRKKEIAPEAAAALWSDYVDAQCDALGRARIR